MNRTIFWLLVVFFLSACSDDGQSPNNTTDAGRLDMSDMSDTDARPDADAGSTCAFQSECSDQEICFEDTCVPARACTQTGLWVGCVQAYEELDRELGIRAYCDGSFCRVGCMDDTECPQGDTCTDYGVCVEFTGELTSNHPGGEARAPLQAGVSNVLMNFPIGVPPAGFGSLGGSVKSPYADLLPPSFGQMHGLFARGLALDNGERELLVIRLPIVFVTGTLHEEVARLLQERTGRDWRDSLVITGTHTHAGPGRHWAIPDDTALPVGTLGTGSFSQEIHNWLVQTIYDAATEALDDRRPAKLGWEIVEAFDMDDLIASDRWHQTPHFDDNRLLMVRVDDANDEPLAVLLSFGMHSTFYEDGYMTGDAGGGVERGFEEAIAKEFDRFVPVMFLNENGGSMSPRGGSFGHEGVDKFEAIGVQFVSRAYETFRNISTQSDVGLNAYTHRFNIGYDEIGYEPGEWGMSGSRTVDHTFWHGGLNCVPPADDDFTTYTDPHDYFCLGIHLVAKNRPVTIARRSQITALQLDDLTIVTLPGEPSMEVGYQVIKHIYEDYAIDWRKAFIWGYAQDHQLYFTPTHLEGEKPFFPGVTEAPNDYPEYAYSYLQGGYEPSLSMWGYKFGDFIVDHAGQAMDGLLNGPKDRPYPIQLTHREFEPVEITASDPARVGLAVQDMPSQVERLNTVEFSWLGGHPGAEAPQAPRVTLERLDGTWKTVETPRLRPYDNTEPVMLTRLRKDGDDHEWIAYWEELPHFPQGRYRFHVTGGYYDEGERQDYALYSNEFEVVPTDDLQIDVQIAGGDVAAWLAYPPAPKLDFVGTDEDPGAVQGGYRMRHAEVASGLPAPVVDIAIDDVTVQVLNSSQDVIATLNGAGTLTPMTRNVGGRMIPGTRFELNLGFSIPVGGSIQIDIVDQHGNSGTFP